MGKNEKMKIGDFVWCKDCKYCLIDLSDRQHHLCMFKPALRKKVNLNDFCKYFEQEQGVSDDEN